MKAAVVLAMLAIWGCSKQATVDVGTGSGAMLTAQPTGSGGSRKAVNAAPVDAAPVDAAPAQRSGAARALEDFDRAFAPVWKLSGAAQLRALCTHRRVLSDRSVALVDAPSGASAGWDEDARALVELVGEVSRACGQIPKTAFSDDRVLVENDLGSAGDLIKPLHDAFAKLVAAVPDAGPIDAHAGDALPPADPRVRPVELGRLRAALNALDAAIAKLATSAKRAKSRADACEGADKLPALVSALSAPDIIGGPPDGDDWSGHLGNLAMVIGNVIDNKCSADSTATAADIASSYTSLHERVSRMLAMCK